MGGMEREMEERDRGEGDKEMGGREGLIRWRGKENGIDRERKRKIGGRKGKEGEEGMVGIGGDVSLGIG